MALVEKHANTGCRGGIRWQLVAVELNQRMEAKGPNRSWKACQSKYDPKHNPSLGDLTVWTKDMDALLLEGVEQVGLPRDWKSVAKHVGGEVDRKQCCSRYAQKKAQKLNNRPWTEPEFELLKASVEKNTTGGKIKWAAVEDELGWSTTACRTKWNNHIRPPRRMRSF
mmetsp:Transcript_13707/g.30090  ORF Transcript_13707/g.30090 Transcript_13707/m.30090 type:complete len:168 (+) Transcript_13707:146-649(+)